MHLNLFVIDGTECDGIGSAFGERIPRVAREQSIRNHEDEAILIARAMLKAGMFQHVHGMHDFEKGGYFYRFTEDGGGSDRIYFPLLLRQQESIESSRKDRETSKPDEAQLVHETFEAQAKLFPFRTALYYPADRQSSEFVAMTYGELSRISSQLAAWLEQQDICAEGSACSPVGIFCEGLWSIVALLAVMKVGRPYLPLDPAYPAKRLQYTVEVARCRVILCTRRERSLSLLTRPGDAVKFIPLDSSRKYWGKVRVRWDRLNGASRSARESSSDSEGSSVSIEKAAADVLYTIFTSGSTGKPKAVCGTHSATLARFRWMWKKYPFDADGEVVVLLTSLCFVDSVFEIFGALGRGAAVLAIPRSMRADTDALLREAHLRKVTRITVVPSMLRSIVTSPVPIPAHIKHWVCSGEALPMSLMRLFFEKARRSSPREVFLLNLYGTTEVSGDVTFQEFSSSTFRLWGEGGVSVAPIGSPIPGNKVVLMAPIGDRALAEVPSGEVGEVFISGSHLSMGYLHDADSEKGGFVWLRRHLVKPAFITQFEYRFCSPGSPGARRWFRTGDFARESVVGSSKKSEKWRLLHFLGRRDAQVKIRGHRVDLLKFKRPYWIRAHEMLQRYTCRWFLLKAA